MRKRVMYGTFLKLFILVSILAFLFACGPKPIKPTSEMDTPEHHFFTGKKFLEEGRYDAAMSEFEQALKLDPKFSKAYAGKGLVKAYQKDFKAAEDQMDTAWKYANTNEEKVFANVGYMRLYTLRQTPAKWLEMVKDKFDVTLKKFDPKSSATYFYMGIAYKTALQFDQAEPMFAKVLDLKGELTNEANIQWELIQKIKRAMPGTITGKKIALVEKITRADAAALFMEELKVDVLYNKRTVKTFDTAFKDPEKAKMKPAAAAITASDIANVPLKADIEGIIKLGVRGLEIYPDGTFDPYGLVNRAAYAMMIEDILIKVTGDNKLATKFIGERSPFPDLRPDLPYFNAVMVVTSRGVMKGNFATGQFDPEGSISGADALLIIKELKEQLKI